MNKKIIFLILLFLILITSCSTKSYNVYNTDDSKIYADSLYEAINTSNIKYAAFDLRESEHYLEKHLKQMQNYDLEKNNLNDFISYLSDNYSKDYYIYLYSDININLDNLKGKYKIVNLLIMPYQDFNKQYQDYFIFDSGEYDCGC